MATFAQKPSWKKIYERAAQKLCQTHRRIQRELSRENMKLHTIQMKEWYYQSRQMGVELHRFLHEYLQYHDQKNQSDINPNSIDSELKNDKQKSRYIPREVQDRVWRRDEGKCVDCGSNENLEFDHIIPHSKGGANTYRNIQLLCEKCNRSKSDNIG